MIDPKLLTEENGFVEGVVVEVEWEETSEYPSLFKWWRSDWEDWEIRGFLTIRPLTGPMAIWNFAPDWAKICLQSGQGLYRFFSANEWAIWEKMMFDGEHDTISVRPWWSK